MDALTFLRALICRLGYPLRDHRGGIHKGVRLYRDHDFRIWWARYAEDHFCNAELRPDRLGNQRTFFDELEPNAPM